MNIKGISLPHVNAPSFDFSSLTAQIQHITGVNQMFLLLVILFIFLYGLSVGKTRAILSLLALYVGLVLAMTFPFLNDIKKLTEGRLNPSLVQAVLFVLFYLGVSLVFNLSSLKHRLSLGELSFTKVIVISIFQVLFLASILIFLLPVDALPAPARSLQPYLGSQRALFFWALVSLIILPFMKGDRRER